MSRNGRKGDTNMMKMAVQLQQETTITFKRIAQFFVMGHWRTALNATHALPKKFEGTSKICH